MVAFPNCKINIGLNVAGIREDGFHNIQTIFYPIGLTDILEIIEAGNAKDHTVFSCTGSTNDISLTDNLCTKAYSLVKKDFPRLPAIQIHLHKNIPAGAGLGGGSSDSVFMLMLLNKKFGLNLSQEQLFNYASQLGSDCPFFLINKPCHGSGRGELLEEIRVDLSGYKILLVHPGININTGQAFSEIVPAPANDHLREYISTPVKEWKKLICNDFEKPVFARYPEIKNIKKTMYESGAIYASMSGSGSSVYGIFEKENMPVLNFATEYFYKWV